MPNFDAMDHLQMHLSVRKTNRLDRFPDWRATTSDGAPALVALTGELSTELHRTRADKNLSEVGRRDRALSLLTKAAKAVDRWEEEATKDVRADLDHYDGLFASLTDPAPVDSNDALRQEMRHSEIRRGLGELDPSQANLRYSSYPDEVRAALRTAPPVLVKDDRGNSSFQSLIDPATVEAHAQSVVERDHPLETAVVADLNFRLNNSLALAGVVRSQINEAIEAASRTGGSETEGEIDPATIVGAING